MAYIGQGIKQGTFKVLDTSGNTYNGSNTTFSLGTQVGSAAQLLVSHDGVIQLPGTDYTLASGGASITFSTAPASGASIFIVEISGAVGGTVTPSDNSVGITQLNVSDGSNGQALTTNGSGTLSFSTISTGLTGIDDQSSSNDDQLTITDTAVVINEDSDDVDFRVESNGNANMLFVSGGNDVVGIGAEGDLGVGLHIKSADSGASADSSADELVIESSGQGGINILTGNSVKGNIFFGDDGDTDIGRLSYSHNDNSMRFTTNASERMRIDSTGRVQIGTTDQNAYLQVHNDGNATYAAFFRGHTTETVLLIRSNQSSGNNRAVDFIDSDGTLCGSINVNAGGNTVSYETSSDYRLKENVIDLTGAITRVKNLKPKRFNFTAKPDTTLDGFLAHEVQSVVSEAASGTKDATETKKNVVVNNKGNVEHEGITEEDWKQGKIDEKFANDTQWFAEKEFIKPQGVDSSKLVPLLTAALQEAVTKIEALEARVTTLEG
jgi:hypothetical protein